jgi:nitroreductase
LPNAIGGERQATFTPWSPARLRYAQNVSMQTWDAISSRRNVRSFSPQPVSAGHLDQILEAGRRAPSSRNTQPWDFVLVTDPAQLRELAAVWVGAAHVASSAATIALITSEEGGHGGRVQFDLGQVTMSIMLAAADLGIGSCHAGIGDQDLARRLLGLPADRTCAFLISLGYPAGRPLAPIRNPDRRPFDEIVHNGTW